MRSASDVLMQKTTGRCVQGQATLQPRCYNPCMSRLATLGPPFVRTLPALCIASVAGRAPGVPHRSDPTLASLTSLCAAGCSAAPKPSLPDAQPPCNMCCCMQQRVLLRSPRNRWTRPTTSLRPSFCRSRTDDSRNAQMTAMTRR
eukprot:360678-Chlamydomonas_euryale.AAC.2